MRLALLANLGGALGALGGNFALVRGEHELVGRRAPAQLLERRRQRIQPRLELGEPPFERYVLGGCAPLARLDGRLHQALRRRCEASLGFAVDFSAGAVRVAPGEALSAAIQRADDQLYRAKHAGRGRTCCADGVL